MNGCLEDMDTVKRSGHQVADEKLRRAEKGNNVLLVSFEDLKRDLKFWVMEIAGFLDGDHPGVLMKAKERLEDIVKRTSFETMKKLKFVVPDQASQPVNGYDDHDHGQNNNATGLKPGFHEQNFFKCGRINYGFNYFNCGQKELMFKRIQDTFQENHPQILDLWHSHGVPVNPMSMSM